MADDSKKDEKQEAAEIDERQAPSSQIVHDAILHEGEDELERTSSNLGWSGFAAGMSMALSLIAEAALHSMLPDTPWRPLVSKLGYSVGFMVVILGRQQLFTENTLTPILPLMEHRDGKTLFNVARLWAVVLVTNLIGGAIAAFALARTPALTDEIKAACFSLAREATAPTFGVIVCKGVVAGWIIALLVWLQPFAEGARFWVILLLTWVIGIGSFSHGIAGSVDAFLLASGGEISWAEALTQFTVPSLLGNIIGGIALVAAVNHAQVKSGDEKG